MTGASVQSTADQRQQRIAEEFMQYRHSSWCYSPFEAVPQYYLISSTELIDKWLQCRKIITIVGVAHDHEPAARSLDARTQRVPISFRSDVHDARPKPTRNRLGIVRAAVVSDDHLTINVVQFEIGKCLSHTRAYRARFVETRHNDGQFEPKIIGRYIRFHHRDPRFDLTREARPPSRSRCCGMGR